MRLTDYVGASLALLFTAGKLIACPLPSSNASICSEPLDIIDRDNGYTIVPRQPRAAASIPSKTVTASIQIGSAVKIDAVIHNRASARPSPITHSEVSR